MQRKEYCGALAVCRRERISNKNEEGILYADLDLAEVSRGRFDFDVVGHYARPDVFQLVVNEQAMSPVVNKPNVVGS